MIWHQSVHPFVSPVGILSVTHQGAAFDAACVHFGPTIRRTDVCVMFILCYD